MNTVHTHATDTLGARAGRWSTIAVVIGLLSLAVAAFLGHQRADDFRRFEHAWLVSCLFFLSISIGGLFFVIVQHLTRAGWSVVVRRVAEFVASNVLVIAVLMAPLVALTVLGNGSLYPWADHAYTQAHVAVANKATYLDGRFFALRCVVYFGTWWWLGRGLLKRSLQQDTSSDAQPTLALERRAPLSMIAFALTVNFAAFDLLMSLSPEWYSTIFGIYFFAGSVIAFFSTAVLALRFLQKNGLLTTSVNVEHYHDLGKFLFAFAFFWSYVAFSQYMLIWYADMPEETVWFRVRAHGSWAFVSYVLLFGHFAIPFAGLISRHAKRRLALLTFWAVWMLVMHAVDLFWIVMPGAETDGTLVSLIDVACFLAVGGIWMFALLRRVGQHSLTPVGDPRLPESLAFENL